MSVGSVGFFNPRISGYNISKSSDGMYSVAVNNGNFGACRMNKEQFDNFVNQQKANNNVQPTKANVAVIATVVPILSAIAADILFAKGVHISSLLNKLKGTELKNLAKLRVDSNVVKRNVLKYDDFLADINKLASGAKVKKGEAINVFKASAVPKEANFANLGLKDNAVVLAKNDGTILKIYDTSLLDNNMSAALIKNLKITV